MMMSFFYIYLPIIIPLIIVVILLYVSAGKKRKEEIETVFGERQELSERDFYEAYFQDKGIPFFVVQKIRQILEEVLDADLSRLSSKDDFSKNLNFFWEEDSLADVEILKQIEEEFNIKFYQEDFKTLETLTVNDIVNIVWKKVQNKDEFSN